MTILLLTDSAEVVGGAEKVALLSAVGLAECGHEVIVFAGGGETSSIIAGASGVRVVSLGMQPFHEAGSKLQALRRVVWNSTAAAELDAVLSRLDPSQTVVHAHSYMRVLTPSVLHQAQRRGFRLVVTMHDYGLACPAMSFYQVPQGRICHLKPLSVACCTTQCTARGWPQKVGILARSMRMRRAGLPSRIDALIAVSGFSAAIMKPYLPPAPLHVVPNPSLASRRERVAAESNCRFVYVGRLTPEKDPALLAKAAALKGFDTVFVGEGPQREAIESALPAARITGWQSEEEVDRHLAGARALVVPSRWYEGAPLVVGEALSRGIPVVVSDACAGRDAVVHGETGLIFPCGDVAALAAALEELLDDAVASRMSAAAYSSYWENPPTLKSHVTALNEIYEQTLSLRS